MSELGDGKISTDALIKELSFDAPKCRQSCPVAKMAMWLVFSVLYVGAVCFISGVRHDLSDVLQTIPFLFEMGLAFGLFVSAGMASAWLHIPDQGQKSWVKSVPVTLLIVILFWSLIRGYVEGMMMPEKIWYHCSEFGLALESLPIIAITFLSMRSHTTQPVWLMFMNISAVAALGWIGLRLTCPMDEMGHSFMFHLMPAIVIGIIMGFFARKLFRW